MMQHPTLDGRDRIAHLKSHDFMQAAIAKALGRSPAVISRELRRNRVEDGMYYVGLAQRRSAQRRAERPLERKINRPQIRAAVQCGLHHDWSTDQIVGRLRDDSPKDQSVWICASKIYSWIEKDEHRELWKSHLRRRGKRPQPLHTIKPDGPKGAVAFAEHERNFVCIEGRTASDWAAGDAPARLPPTSRLSRWKKEGKQGIDPRSCARISVTPHGGH